MAAHPLSWQHSAQAARDAMVHCTMGAALASCATCYLRPCDTVPCADLASLAVGRREREQAAMVAAHPHSRLLRGGNQLGSLPVQGQHHEGVRSEAPAPLESPVCCMALQDPPRPQRDAPKACSMTGQHGSVRQEFGCAQACRPAPAQQVLRGVASGACCCMALQDESDLCRGPGQLGAAGPEVTRLW